MNNKTEENTEHKDEKNQVRFSIPTPNGNIQIDLSGHKALFILGKNGTGKSALVHHIRNNSQGLITGDVIYLPGSRPSYFSGDSLGMTPQSRSQYAAYNHGWDSSPDIRIRPTNGNGTDRNECAIYDLQAAELQYKVQAANDIEADGINSPAITRLQSHSSPLNRVNRLLQQSNLPIQTIIKSGELKALRDGNIYSISKMSDGERTALILIADVIAAKSASIFLVDEPELHLHRAIIVPLLSALLAERPDCTIIISTHELALANDHPENPIILVRGCTWNGSTPSTWILDVLPNSENIPDDLRIDLLGSRKTILFIEGISTSRDQPLYATLFPNVSLRCRSSCTDVRRAVVGLRETEAFHHVSAFGLIDNDGMDEEYQAKLLEEGVYALPIFAVESLYYSPEMIAAVAARQAGTLGSTSEILLMAAKEKALSTLKQEGKIQHLAARVAERQMRDKLLEAMPDRAAMVANGNAPLNVFIASPYPATLARIQGLLQAGNLDAIVAGFPVREAGILDDIAKSLHFTGKADYEKAVLAAISIDSDLAQSIKAKLGGLAEKLGG
jgi:ABC-type cobalamin/Fe3+-siderophores transport system ATPase subunit